MMRFILFLGVVAAAYAADGYPRGLRVKFDIGVNPGQTFFFNVPQSVSDAEAEDWSLTARPAGPLPQLLMYCPQDRVLCALFDDTEYIAGLQIAVSKSASSDNAFSWETRGFSSWLATVNGTIEEFWTIQQYFVSEESLQTSAEERIANRDSTRTLQEGAIWLTGTGGNLLKVSTNEDDIENSIFKKQACMAWMGQHYYYNMTTTMECTADQMYPWFVMATARELLATGFINFVKLNVEDDQKDWFEHPDVDTVKAIVPEAPQCVYDYATSPGTLTMHIYYTDEPWTITC